MRSKTIDIISLGCSKNLVDTERMIYHLEKGGWRCRLDAQRPCGEIVIINTCGFICDAKQESIDAILRFAARKREGKLTRLYVMGCLSERYRAELEKEIPEVDKWYGKFDYLGLAAELSQGLSDTNGRVVSTPNHYAYLKISEGCNRFCSYCAIPLITGRHTSRKMEDIVEEVRQVVGQYGVKEINVIAQDLSSYGLDLYGEHRIAQLVEAITEVEGVAWVRLHYAYPADFPEELLDVMAHNPKVCKYLDIALQHTTDHMLEMMRRHISSAEQDRLIQHIREAVPGICIRTTLMVGHPGETEEDFAQLCHWVKKMRFDRMGAFAYSEEDGTWASEHYKDDVSEETKQRRLSELMAIQQEISNELLQTKVGSKQEVIIDRQEGDYFIGRTRQDSPEVDCEVLIKASCLQIGQIYEVTITKSEDFDLYAEL